MDKKIKKYLKSAFALKIVKYTAVAVWLIASTGFNVARSQISYEVDTNNVAWGERATITARIGVNATDNLFSTDTFPLWTDSIPGGFEVLEVIGPDTLKRSENDPADWDFVVEKKWVVTAWEEASVDLPGARISVTPTLASEEKQVEVQAEIIDVKWTTTDQLKRAAPYLAYFLAALVIIILVIKTLEALGVWNSEKKTQIDEETIPAHILALEKLRELKERQSWLKGDAKTFQVELSGIIREYIDKRFMVQTLDKTSDEAVKIIKMLDISDGDKYAIESALKVGDQIKFAKFKAAEDLHLKSLNACIDLVNNTKPSEDEVG